MLAWLTINESEVATLDIRGVYRFLRHDCHCPADVRNQSAATSPWHAYRFLSYLLETGQAAVPAAIVTGGGLVEALAATLVAQGYREATVRGVRSACRHLVVWLYRSELALGEIEDRVLQRFLDHRCDCVHPGFFGRSGRSSAFAGSRRTQAELARFTSFLIDRDVVADWPGPLPKASGGVPYRRLPPLAAPASWCPRHHLEGVPPIPASPVAVARRCPGRLSNLTVKASSRSISRLTASLRHPLSTLHDARYRTPR